MKKFFDSLNPSLLFIFSLLCLPGILFQQYIIYLWIDLALFAVLSALKKGGFRIVPPLVICFSIVFFNLFQADGYVLFSVFSFRVTSGALQEGLKKSGVLLAMVFVSQYAVSRNVNLPGRAGGFLSRVFRYFDALNEKAPLRAPLEKKETHVKKIRPFKAIGESVSLLMEKTDERLLSVFFSAPEAEEAAGDKPAQSKASLLPSLFISVLPLFPVYLLLILSRLRIFPV
ncbi:hypothetical protein V1L52_07135 [Treponema sp. HNW]|uniref:hypothetical protein n=1 Tax=Treponema sp. HNW TaxID=3116654 RepID=UPI003D0F8145